jgi:putative glycosyltransferase (TIGR04372 family)
MSFSDTIYYLFKKRWIINFLSFFIFLLPNFIVYHLFKNSLRVGLYHVSKKCFLNLSNKNLKKNLSFKFLISKIVFFEIIKSSKLNYTNLIDNDYYDFLNFVNSFQKKYSKKYSKKNVRINSNIIEKLILEFMFCDIQIPFLNKLYQAEFMINFKGKKINNVSLDSWWFKAIGHMVHIDTLIKAILTKMIKIKKISFNVKENKICNLYLYEKYKNILIKEKIFSKKPIKENLNMRYWYVNKLKNFYHTDNLFEFVQLKSRHNWQIIKKFSYEEEKKDFEILRQSMRIDKEIITIHIRQPGFHLEDSNSKIRNSNLNKTLAIIDNIDQNKFTFVLLGGANLKHIDSNLKNIFNYSKSNFKNPKNDILLLNNCIGHIGTESGITHMMKTINKPSLLINWSPFEYSQKNDLSVILPKILKNKNNIFSIRDYYKINPRINYDGIERMQNLNLKYFDNSEDELYNSINRFLNSLDNNIWNNYGKVYRIEKKNYLSHGISLNMNKNVLKVREKIYFDPYFIKKYPNFL